MSKDRLLQVLKTTGGWVFVVFCLLLALGAGACVGSLLLVITAVLALPIKPIRGIWDKLLGVQNIPAIPEGDNARWYELNKKSAQKKQRAERENKKQRKALKPAIIRKRRQHHLLTPQVPAKAQNPQPPKLFSRK